MPKELQVVGPKGAVLPPDVMDYPSQEMEAVVQSAAGILSDIITAIKEHGVDREEVHCKCGEVLQLPPPLKDQARILRDIVGMMDTGVRLHSFTQGGPDQRIEMGFGDEVLKYLTQEQLSEFSQWVEEGKRRLGE